MGNKASSTLDRQLQGLYGLPKKYKQLKILGEGAFGVVLKCLDKDTKDTVAIKIAKASGVEIEEEAFILRLLMENKLDQQNIVKFHGGFWRNKYMVFEMLDINLDTYLKQRNAPMCLQDIRAVMQQMATAFDALKKISVIHTDLKTDNIMVVDRAKKPFKVKLIDFGLAIFKFRAKDIRVDPVPDFRAPEIIFGLPYSEAMDIWSLGCVMAIMVFGFTLFPGRSDAELLHYISDLMGPPPDHMIAASSRSECFYTKDANNHWIPKDYHEDGATDRRRYSFRSLDEMKTLRLEEDNATEEVERTQCIELLKAILTWDEKERITPEGILNHPFITKSYLSKGSQHSGCNGVDESSQSSRFPADSNNEEDRPSGGQSIQHDGAPPEKLPSGIILVQPAPLHRRSPLEQMAEVETISVTPASMSEDCNGNDVLDNKCDSLNKPKNRKNCVKRVFSWLRKRVCPCRKMRVAPM